MPPRLWARIDPYYGLIAVLLSLVLAILGVSLHAAIPNTALVGFVAVLLAATAVLNYYLKTRHDKYRAMALHSSFIDSLLDACAFSVLQASGAPVQHVRACLMFPDKKNRYLHIRYAHNFRPEDRDRGIKVPIGTGCCGQAWIQGTPLYADLTEAPVGGMPEQWGIPDPEIGKIRKDLKSILSVPVRAGEHFDVVAMLNLDSDNHVDDIAFKTKAIQDICYSFSKVLGSLIEETL